MFKEDNQPPVLASQPEGSKAWTWYAEGDRFFADMLAAVDAAQRTVRLETYIWEASGIGIRMRDKLVSAAQRGVQVQVLVDGFGSSALPGTFWDLLRVAGGNVRVFNPQRRYRLSIRDHRKLLVCDDEAAFVGGFNLATNYEGNGVQQGWRDIAIRVTGPLASALGATFDRMYAGASFQRKIFLRIRRTTEKSVVGACGCEIILGGPGRGRSPLQQALCRDLAVSRSVQILVAYFLPTGRLRRALTRVARRGAVLELIVPGKSDVALSKLATESLYSRLLRSGAHIFEYQPQMLHGKLFILDDAVYVGSSNLDPRSLRLNFEIMLRLEGRAVAAAARVLFADCRQHSHAIQQDSWRRKRSLWVRLKQRFAHMLMTRLDPWIAMSQWRKLPD